MKTLIVITLGSVAVIAALAIRTAVILHSAHGFTWDHAWHYVILGG